MFKNRIDVSVLTDPSWWHWALTAPLLALQIAKYSWAMWIAFAMSALVTSYLVVLIQQLRPYPVQLRLAYLLILLSGRLPGMEWIYWALLIGTLSKLIMGYCPLLRILSLAPWNRNGPLTFSHVWHAFVREPCDGGIVRWRFCRSEPPTMSCGVRLNLPKISSRSTR